MQSQQIFSFHDARLSLVQSCLREMVCKPTGSEPNSGLRAGHPRMDEASAVLKMIDEGTIGDAHTAIAAYNGSRPTDTDRAVELTSGITEACLDLLVDYTLAWFFDDQAEMTQIVNAFKFNQCDPGWLTAVVEWFDYYELDGQAPQYNPPVNGEPGPIPLPTPAAADGVLRVGLLSDWGTGESDAWAVLDQLMQQKPDLILHLGDIYYAGTVDECQTNFLDLINDARTRYQSQIPVYTLPGNHDYYSGGIGYYSMLPQINNALSGEQVQTHSFFCLQNDHWQLEGMDTGYNDHDPMDVDQDTTSLQQVEVDWHTQQIGAAGSRNVVLFSHHQLFSAFEQIAGTDQNASLTANLLGWQEAGKNNIVAWFWGHEHLLEVYADPVPNQPGPPIVGRCIGNGAIPVSVGTGAYTPISDTFALLEPSGWPDGIKTGNDGLIYNHGFALLELGAGSGTASYYQVLIPADGSASTSQSLWTEPIPKSPS